MKQEDLSRRHLFVLSASALVAWSVTGCKKGPPSSCNDVSGLSAADAEARKALEYVDRSPVAAQTCDKCQQWVEPPSADQCGGCKVMKGPVHPQGHCKVFVAKA